MGPFRGCFGVILEPFKGCFWAIRGQFRRQVRAASNHHIQCACIHIVLSASPKSYDKLIVLLKINQNTKYQVYRCMSTEYQITPMLAPLSTPKPSQISPMLAPLSTPKSVLCRHTSATPNRGMPVPMLLGDLGRGIGSRCFFGLILLGQLILEPQLDLLRPLLGTQLQPIPCARS